MKALLTIVLAAMCVSIARAEEPKETPDFASMDQAVLVVMCEQLWNRIQSLEEKIEKMEARIGAGVGASEGEEVSVDGGLTVVQAGSWVITIANNPEPDIQPLLDKIKAERQKLPGVDARLVTANKALQSLVNKGSYHKTRNKWGYRRADKSRLEKDVRSVERERQVVDRNIADYQRQIETLQASRTILGTTDDGKTAKIIARGIYHSMGVSLQVEQTYTITGRGNITDSGVMVYLKTATPITN